MTFDSSKKAESGLLRIGFTTLLWTVVLTINLAIVQRTAAESDFVQQKEYKELVQEAILEFKGGRYEEAIALFERAHAIQPNAQTLRGIGMAAYEARHYVRAMGAFRAALKNNRRPLDDKQRKKIEELLEKAEGFVTSYHVELRPPEAHLTVDGQGVTLPEDGVLLLDPGKHEVVAALSGYQMATRQIVAFGGQEERRVIVLRSIKRETEDEIGATEKKNERELGKDIYVHTSLYRTLGWIGVAGATVALTGAVVAWQIGESAADDWNNNEICLRDGRSREENCAEEYNTFQTARIWSIVALSTGVALGIASAVMFVLGAEDNRKNDSSNKDIEEARLRLIEGPGEIGMGLTLTF